jgi:hypothetical protein
MNQIHDPRSGGKHGNKNSVVSSAIEVSVDANRFSQNDDGFRDYLLVAIRCARLRAQLLQSEIDQIGVALKGRMVSPDVALSWLSEIGAIQLVDIGEASQ